jgi:hypothetical protein
MPGPRSQVERFVQNRKKESDFPVGTWSVEGFSQVGRMDFSIPDFPLPFTL